MRTLAGPDASVAFTSLSSATSASLSAAFTDADPPATTTTTTTTTSDSVSPAAAQVQCHEQGILALTQTRNIPHERVCLLDPKASLALTPSDGDAGKFTWFLFGVRLQLCFFASLSRLTLWSYLLFCSVGLVGLGVRVSSVRSDTQRKPAERSGATWTLIVF